MVRYVLVVLIALVFTTLGIDAADTWRGSQSTLLSSLIHSQIPTCAAGTVEVLVLGSKYCVDQYEAGVGPKCPQAEPQSVLDTADNLNTPDCQPVSKAEVLPWRFVTYHQAKQLCARANKSLIAEEVWYETALGTPDNTKYCQLSGGLNPTGNNEQCLSGSGAYDMIGNVWEFVTVKEGTKLPEAGYVAAVTDSGLPTLSDSVPHVEFGDDYVWSKPDTEVVFMRGGFFGAKEDGGLYSVQGTVTGEFSSGAIGFRCMYAL